RRAGWVGCNILLNNVPPDARIDVISQGRPILPAVVRREYAKLKPLARAKHDARGWTLDVLNAVRRLGKSEFSLPEVYEFGDEFSRLHPQNKNVEPKIRQQLQMLRDMGFVTFLGRGRYRA
ncbi:MAG: DpnI domain-containing protein, partial [Deltaproteobacteria bacterium]